MKFFIPFLSSLLLLGCSQESNTPKSSLPDPSTQVVAQTTSTPAQQETPVAPPADAASLFGQQCASCHGAKGEKMALGKSQIIANLTQEQITQALKGYQAKSYGKEMKAIMEGKAKGLNDEQIKLLSAYIPGR